MARAWQGHGKDFAGWHSSAQSFTASAVFLRGRFRLSCACGVVTHPCAACDGSKEGERPTVEGLAYHALRSCSSTIRFSSGARALARRRLPMAANWMSFWRWRRWMAWKALTRLRCRAWSAGGRRVRFLIGAPKALDLDQHAALIDYVRQGGTHERYLAEEQVRAPRGCLAVVNGRSSGSRRARLG
jgi:hypothetical protein